MDEVKKLELNVSENTWFVSDIHFHHEKLCKSCEERLECFRKYSTADEMDADIIKQWNTSVRQDDTVIFAGDFLLNTKIPECREEFYRLKNQLNGNIYFIKGNHDQTIKKELKNEIIFYNYAILTFSGKKYFVQHKDYDGNISFLKKEMKNGLDLDNTFLIHGHTHESVAWKNSRFLSNKRIYNVCWDVQYRPINIKEFA